MSSSNIRRGPLTITVMLATAMQALDMTIANVALPSMQGALSTSLDQISWVLTSYVVAAAICMPLTGFLAARLGRRRLFIWSVILFTISSMLCGFAQNLEQLVLFRTMQGASGAFLVPLSQSVLLDAYPRERHGWAMAVWGIGVMVGPIMGPPLGAWLTEIYNWRWVFFINLPLGLIALLGMVLYIPETEKDRDRRFDLFGFALLALAIGSLQLMLDRGEAVHWFDSPEIILFAILAGGAGYMFVAHICTSKRPFVNPRLFMDRNFSVGLVLIFITGVVLMTSLVLLPPFMQNQMGYPVLDIGWVLGTRGIGTMVAMMLIGKIAGKVDLRWVVATGLLCASLSMWEMTFFTPDVSPWAIVRSGFIQGLGLGFLFVPLATITFATLEPRFRNDGTALFSLVRSIGSSIGVSVVVTYLARQSQANHAVMAEHISPFSLGLQNAVGAGVHQWNTPAGLVALNNEVTRQAVTMAYLQDFHLIMWLSLLALPLVWLLKRA